MTDNSNQSWATMGVEEEQQTEVMTASSGMQANSVMPATPQVDASRAFKREFSKRQKVPNSIIVTDRWDGLEVYHYEDGTTDPALFECRGIIKDGDKIVCKTFGFTPEVLASDNEALGAHLMPFVSDAIATGKTIRAYKSFEGTLLRLWNYNNKWYLSTHRKIDAFRSKWGHDNMSYGALFTMALYDHEHEQTDRMPPMESVMERFTDKLNKEKIYVILLRNYEDNRVVCKGGNCPKLYCIGAFDRSNSFAFSMDNDEMSLPTPDIINIPMSLSSEESTDDRAHEYIQNSLSTIAGIDALEYQGLILMTSDGKSMKCTHPENDRLMKLRGNEPNVVFRYVQLKWTPELETFKALYPEHKEKFDEWEGIYQKIANNIYKKYNIRFKHHRTALLPPDQYAVCCKVNDYYNSTLKEAGEHVTIGTVHKLIGMMSEREVNALIKAYRERAKDPSTNGDGNRMPETMFRNVLNTVRPQGVRRANTTSSESHTQNRPRRDTREIYNADGARVDGRETTTGAKIFADCEAYVRHDSRRRVRQPRRENKQ